MSTGRDLITGALRLIGAVSTGETASSQELTDGLSALNDMIDSWSNENLLVYTKSIESFPLTSGQKTYTMGPAGNFNTVRPLKIDTATLQIQGSSVIERPMQILNQEEWAAVMLKSVSSSIPLYVYPDGGFPLQTLYLWPVPSAANNIGLYSLKQLSNIATVSTALSLPPGYSRALRYNLAVELSPEYGKPVDGGIAQIANDAKENIKRINIKPVYAGTDAALTSVRTGFNWLTGE